MAVVVGLAGCNERYNTLTGPSSAELRAAAGSISEDAAGSGRGRRRAVGQPVQQVEGVVRSVSTDFLVVFSSHREELTIQVVGATVIRHGNRELSLSDIREGDRVHAKVKTVDGLLVAVEVRLQNPTGDEPGEEGTATANGTVTRVSGSELTVRTVPHGDVVVQTDGATIIKRQGAVISVGDIQVGWEVNTRGTRVDAQTILAVQIEVRGNSKRK